MGESLKALNRRLSLPEGRKMMIIVNRAGIPPTPIDEELIETIKTRMSARYDAELKLLNMSTFRDDQQLKQLGIYVALSRPNLLHLVIRIITENIPDIVGINLSDNKISGLEPLASLEKTCKFLQAIDLSKNEVTI